MSIANLNHNQVIQKFDYCHIQCMYIFRTIKAYYAFNAPEVFLSTVSNITHRAQVNSQKRFHHIFTKQFTLQNTQQQFACRPTPRALCRSAIWGILCPYSIWISHEHTFAECTHYNTITFAFAAILHGPSRVTLNTPKKPRPKQVLVLLGSFCAHHHRTTRFHLRFTRSCVHCLLPPSPHLVVLLHTPTKPTAPCHPPPPPFRPMRLLRFARDAPIKYSNCFGVAKREPRRRHRHTIFQFLHICVHIERRLSISDFGWRRRPIYIYAYAGMVCI